MTAAVVALCAAVVALSGGVIYFAKLAFDEGRARAVADEDALLAKLNERAAAEGLKSCEAQLEKLMAANAERERKRADEVKAKIASAKTGHDVAAVSGSVWANMPAPDNPNPLGADPLPVATDAKLSDAKRRR
ncbi:MAG: hypothetical protein E6Q97_38405 [Desulfurellales bacterium]|nr:MAG: hypothetical protein E6Q97_38405 [Desulfurellales bacterium]